MPTGRPIVFISYARKDETGRARGDDVQWLSFVLEFLRPAEMAGVFEIFADQLVPGGAKWEAEIEAKLRICDVFMLLVSPRSMASEWVVKKELPIVRERDARGETVHIYPVLLETTPIAGLDNVRDKNIRPADSKRSFNSVKLIAA
jgi:hypothetical protein